MVARQIRRMNLYISPLSCSYAAHFACIEADLPITLQRVDRKTKSLPDGRDYRTIAPLGIVPAIELPDGSVLTESAAVLQWIADRAPEKNLAPQHGSVERYRLAQWLNFVTTELHKKHLWVIFSSKTTDAMKVWAREGASAPLAYVAKHLEKSDYLLGKEFSVADTYLYWALFVAPHGGLDLSDWPSLVKYVERVGNRPAAKRAMAIEGPLYLAETKTAA